MGKSGKPKKTVEPEIEKGEKPEKAEKKNGLALKKFGEIMVGFGDETPLESTAELLEELAIQFIQETTYKLVEMGNCKPLKIGKGTVQSSRARITLEDLKFVIKNDYKKLTRCNELIAADSDIKQAKSIKDNWLTKEDALE